MSEKLTLLQMLQQAYLLGFNASGEGWNGEYPFCDHARAPAEDAVWLKDRDQNLAWLEAELLSREMVGGTGIEPVTTRV